MNPLDQLTLEQVLWAVPFLFVPHLAATLIYRKYSPGVATGLLLNIPFSIYIFQRTMHEGPLTQGWFWALLIAAPFVMVLITWLFLQIGKWIAG